MKFGVTFPSMRLWTRLRCDFAQAVSSTYQAVVPIHTTAYRGT